MFHSEAANALLKTLEEPAPNITFFFLMRDKEDMIDTIVSRCQLCQFTQKQPRSMTCNSWMKYLKNEFPPSSHHQALVMVGKITVIIQRLFLGSALLDGLNEYTRRLFIATSIIEI